MPENNIVLKVEEGLEIPDGAYTGTIEDVKMEKRGAPNEQFTYVDLYIRFHANPNFPKIEKIVLRDGFPAKITPQSGLGQVLKSVSGLDLEKPGAQIDVVTALKGKKVRFLTTQEVTARGTFARVVRGSIKPV